MLGTAVGMIQIDDGVGWIDQNYIITAWFRFVCIAHNIILDAESNCVCLQYVCVHK